MQTSIVTSRNEGRRPAYVGAALVTALLLGGSLASAAEPDNFQLIRTVPLPNGAKLGAVDIGRVDQYLRAYAVSDATNASVDMIDLNTGNLTMMKPTGAAALAGKPPDPNAGSPNFNDVMGPNGLIMVNHTEIWVGDAPSLAGPLVQNANLAIAYANDNCNSGVKVFSMIDQTVTDVINLGGCFRTDEGDWDPVDNVVLIANPAEQPIGKGPTAPFISIISSNPVAPGQHHQILKKITFDGTNGTPNAVGGIEQPIYSSVTGLFYISIPQNGPSDTGGNGAVAVVDPRGDPTAIQVVNVFPLQGCSPNGAAVGPGYELFLGCSSGAGSPGAQIIDIRTGQMIAKFPQLKGCDEVNYNPGDGHFLGACGGLGIVDSDPPSFDQLIPGPAHGGIAGDPVTGQIYTAVTTNGALCGASPNNGCIAIFGAPVTQAILSVPALTTNQNVIIANASGSTSATGSLEYLFIAVPGANGLTPVITQSPTNPQATVFFNAGPGNYSLELVVVDGNGNTSTSTVTTINYTGP